MKPYWSEKYFLAIYPGVALLLVLTVYAQVVHHQFLDWDDIPTYIQNPHLRGFSLGNLYWLFTSPGEGIWMPLTYLSFLLEFSFLDPASPSLHLLINPLLHAINAVLVGYLVSRLLTLLAAHSIKVLDSQQKIGWAGLLACMLFAVHPLNVEAAAWLTGRKELLATVFYLLSVLSWVSWLSTGRKFMRWFLCAWLCQLLSLLCKSMAVSLPVVLLLLDALAQRNFNWRVIVLEKLPFWLLSVSIIPLAIWGQYSAGALPGLEKVTAAVRIAQGVDSYLMYLSRFVFPANLLPYYPSMPAVEPVRFIAGVFMLTAMLTIAVMSFLKGTRIWLLVLGWYVVVFFPVAGWIQIATHRTADRYAYLPMIPFYGVLAVFLIRILAKQIHLFVFVITCFIITLAVAAHQQTRIWRSDRALWEYSFQQQQPVSPLVLLNLGITYLKAKDNDQALALFKQAADAAPDDIYYLETWMMSCAELKNWRCALDASLRGMKRYPHDHHFVVQTSFFLAFQQDYPAALQYFSMAIAMRPDNIQARWGEAYVLAAIGKKQEALFSLGQLLLIDPNHAHARELQTELQSKE